MDNEELNTSKNLPQIFYTTLTAVITVILARVRRERHNILQCSLLGPWEETAREVIRTYIKTTRVGAG
jgi:hypothetical protein